MKTLVVLGVKKYNKYMNIYNCRGGGYCDAMTKEKIEEAIMEADSAMYADKSFLKGKIRAV